MARDHARIQTNIWIDDDFLDLTPAAQHLYFVLCSQMKLNFCGVTDWHTGRLSQLASGWGVGAVEAAAAELSKQLYIVVDEVTGEVLVRSFIRNDGLLVSPNMAKAMLRAYSEIGSRTLRSVVVHELIRLHDESPLLKGWQTCSELLGKRSVNPSELDPYNPSGNPSVNPSINPSDAAEGNPSVNPSHAPYSLLPTPYSPTPDSPQKQTHAYGEDFEKAWDLYPLKRDKKAASKAFAKARKEVPLDRLLVAIARYRDDPNREPRFTKHFGTWLNAGSWDDEPLPAQTGKQTAGERRLQKGLALIASYDQQQNPQRQIGA